MSHKDIERALSIARRYADGGYFDPTPETLRQYNSPLPVPIKRQGSLVDSWRRSENIEDWRDRPELLKYLPDPSDIKEGLQRAWDHPMTPPGEVMPETIGQLSQDAGFSNIGRAAGGNIPQPQEDDEGFTDTAAERKAQREIHPKEFLGSRGYWPLGDVGLEENEEGITHDENLGHKDPQHMQGGGPADEGESWTPEEGPQSEEVPLPRPSPRAQFLRGMHESSVHREPPIPRPVGTGEQSLTEYQPTWREKAQAALEGEHPSETKKRIIREGLGGVDLGTGAFSAQEALQRGHPQEAAMAIMPGAKGKAGSILHTPPTPAMPLPEVKAAPSAAEKFFGKKVPPEMAEKPVAELPTKPPTQTEWAEYQAELAKQKSPPPKQEAMFNPNYDLHPHDVDQMTAIGGSKGTGQGVQLADNQGNKWYAKVFPDTEIVNGKPVSELANNEKLAAELYRRAGVNVADTRLTELNGQPAIASRMIPNVKQFSEYPFPNGNGLKGLHEGFPADVWLANGDTIGAGMENPKGNILYDKHNNAYRIDFGGAMRFGGLGGKKTWWGPKVNEFSTFAGPLNKNKTMNEVFSHSTPEIAAGQKEIAQNIANISDSELTDLVHKYGPKNISEAGDLLHTLAKRRDQVAEHYGVKPGGGGEVGGGGGYKPQIVLGHWNVVGPDGKPVIHGTYEHTKEWAEDYAKNLNDTMKAGHPWTYAQEPFVGSPKYKSPAAIYHEVHEVKTAHGVTQAKKFMQSQKYSQDALDEMYDKYGDPLRWGQTSKGSPPSKLAPKPPTPSLMNINKTHSIPQVFDAIGKIDPTAVSKKVVTDKQMQKIRDILTNYHNKAPEAFLNFLQKLPEEQKLNIQKWVGAGLPLKKPANAELVDMIHKLKNDIPGPDDGHDMDHAMQFFHQFEPHEVSAALLDAQLTSKQLNNVFSWIPKSMEKAVDDGLAPSEQFFQQTFNKALTAKKNPYLSHHHQEMANELLHQMQAHAAKPYKSPQIREADRIKGGFTTPAYRGQGQSEGIGKTVSHGEYHVAPENIDVANAYAAWMDPAQHMHWWDKPGHADHFQSSHATMQKVWLDTSEYVKVDAGKGKHGEGYTHGNDLADEARYEYKKKYGKEPKGAIILNTHDLPGGGATPEGSPITVYRVWDQSSRRSHWARFDPEHFGQAGLHLGIAGLMVGGWALVDRKGQAIMLGTNSPGQEGMARGGRVSTGHAKIGRDAFLYMNPKPPKNTFAQCGTCLMFTGTGCTILGKTKITKEMTCGLYVRGNPQYNMKGKELSLVTPEEAGLVNHQVRCENCRYGGEHCALFNAINKCLPSKFDLETKIDSKGCCNAFTKKD